MSHLSKVFNQVPVKVPNRSGFDLSHENLFSAKVGTLIPASVEEVMPGDVVSIGSAFSVELPPLATNFKGRVDARLEAFFVPNRILWAGWQDFITQAKGTFANGSVTGGGSADVPGFGAATIPTVSVRLADAGVGSLADYLGFKPLDVDTTVVLNALPFLAYQKIWDDWYRDSNVQKPFFYDGLASVSSGYYYAAGSPYLRTTGTLSQYGASPANNTSVLGVNGKYLTQLNQRNFAKDYFTTMTTRPQAGANAALEFSVEDSTGSFSIASLRVANSLQKWLEKNNIAGTRYYDQILAHYGVLPPDANVDRAILLGTVTNPVIINSLSQTSQETSNLQTKNPYAGSTGAQFGKGNAFGEGRLVDKFEVKEHGYIMVLFSLVPHAYYSTGCRRYLSKRSSSDTFAFPEFANIGDQPVYLSELYSPSLAFDTDETVGYSQRYSEYKYHDDEVHGLLADGQSLDSFVLQRGFDRTALISDSLLQIPTNYMDNVMVTTSAVSGFNAIVDCYFDSKFLRVLPEYSLPSLGEYQGSHEVDVPKGGRRL
mgnify:CR=1 FL=1